MRFLPALSIVVIGGLLPAPAPLRAQRQVTARLDSLFRKHLAAHRFTGAAIVLVRDTSVVFARGYGEADVKTHAAVDPARTVFRAASVSKVFTATAVMQLVESGRVRMTDDINQYVKWPARGEVFNTPATLASLLTHTSGLENRALGSIARDSGSLVPLANYFDKRPPRADARPGEQFAYSNNGVGLAGYVVQAVSGEPFDEYVQRHILAPLGMVSSSFRQPVPETLRSRMAGGERARRAPLFNPYPAGALMTTPLDMGRFVIAQLNHGQLGAERILSADVIADMHATHWRAHPKAPGVAYGYFEARYRGHRALFHTGDSGHHGIIFLLPDDRIGFYAVFDTQDDGSHEMMEEIVHVIVDDLPAVAVAAPAPERDTSSAGQYAGVYGVNGADPHTIEKLGMLMAQVHVEDVGAGRLRVVPPGSEPMIVTRVAPDLFRGSDSAFIAFTRSAHADRIDLMTVTGGISDPFGAHRLPWYARASLHFAIIAAAALTTLWRLLYAMVALFKHTPPQPASKRAQLGWRLSGLMVMLCVLTPVLFIAGLVISRPPYTALPAMARLGLVSLLLASVIAIALPAFAVIAWRKRSFTRARRVGFSVLSVTSCLAAMSFAYWNITTQRL